MKMSVMKVGYKNRDDNQLYTWYNGLEEDNEHGAVK